MRLWRVLRNCGEIELEQRLGNLLRFGVVTAAAVVLIGWGIHLGHHGGTPANYGVFKGEPTELRHISGIVRSAGRFEPDALIQLGLLLLLATPVARVAFSVFAFACQRDWIYVMFTILVLSILLYSIISGNH